MLENEKKLVDVLTDVADGKTTAIKVVREMVGDDPVATIEITQKPVLPIRSESPARNHAFYDATGFIAFIEENKTANTIVLADPLDRQARAVLDDHASQGFETVYMQPRFHPLMEKVFKTILCKRGSMMEVKEFAIQVLRCRDVIVGNDKMSGNDIAMLMQHINISSQVKANHGVGKKAVNGLMCTTEVKGVTGEGELVEMPDGITIEVPIFLNTEPVKFTIDLTVRASQSEAYITADSPDLDVQMFEVFSKMLEPIKEMKDVLFSLGVSGTRVWDYIK